MKEIIEAGYALHHWFCRHNLPTEGVRIILEFPTDNARYHADCAFRMDALPEMMPDVSLRPGETLGRRLDR